MGASKKSRAIDHIGSAVKYGLQENGILPRVIFQVRVLDNDNVALYHLKSRPQSSAFSLITVMVNYRYILLGLVVIHVLSRLSPFRLFILFSVYVGLIFFGWIALIVATIGMAEPIFNLRDRFSATPPPRTPDAD